MDQGSPPSDADAVADAPSPQEGSVGLGSALRLAWLGYQVRLDEAMTVAGFGEQKFPNGRVLRLCSGPTGSTISGIGRELGITRQGAGRVVGHLCDRGYVSVADSATSVREKSVTLTPRGAEYLAAYRKAARGVERQLRSELGDAGFVALHTLLGALGQDEHVRMRSYLQPSNAERASRGF